jgi:hypothetical protein
LIVKHALAGVSRANVEIGSAFTLQTVEFVKTE